MKTARLARLLVLAPLGLVLAGCMTYGGDVYSSYNQPGYGYSYPSYSYSYPTTRYSYPYSYGSPAVVAPSGSYYYPSYSVSRYDRDGDGVADQADRFPYDSRRW